MNHPKNWSQNPIHPNTYFAIANSESDYIQLVKNLFTEIDLYNNYGGGFTYKDHLFKDEVQAWHVFFDTECVAYDNDTYEDGNTDLPLPSEYNGEIKEKPDIKLYPCIVVYDADMKTIMWHPLKELQNFDNKLF